MSGTQVIPVTELFNKPLFSYQGIVDASLSANLPVIRNKGDYYKVSVGGTFENSPLINPTSSSFIVGDAIVWNGSGWDKIDNTDSPLATETVPGIVELATPPETITGSASNLAVHPAGLSQALARTQIDIVAANHTVVETDSNAALTNKGNNGSVIFTLPSFSSTLIGKKFLFIRIVANSFTINANTGDRLSAGTSVSNTALGQTYANITLSPWNDTGGGGVLWIIESSTGTWVTV